MAKYSIEYGQPNLADELDPPLRGVTPLGEEIADVLGRCPNYLFGKTRKEIRADLQAMLRKSLPDLR